MSPKNSVRPFLRYPGSKYNAAKFIEPYWSNLDFNEYREPFLGSGAIFFRIPKVEISWLNDSDDELINVFQVVANKDSRSKLQSRIESFVPTKESFEELKAWQPKTKFDRAYRYFIINRTSYSGIMKMPNWGFHETKSVQPDKWATRLEDAGRKLAGAKITSLDFEELISAGSSNSVWMFLDPPYYSADQKRAYVNYFQLNDHLRLASSLRETKHRFCLTYDNCPEIKELYSWANINEIDWRYHTANSNVTTRKMGKELIICNY